MATCHTHAPRQQRTTPATAHLWPLPCHSTDALILLKVLVHHGVPLEQAAAKLPDMQAAMVAHFQANTQVGGGLSGRCTAGDTQ